MSPTTETEKATCEGCGKEFDFEPVSFRGRALAPPSKCTECDEADEKKRQAEEAREQAEARFQHRAKSARLPSTLRAVTYPDGTPDAVRRWGAGEIQGLCLTGSVGVGKTHLAAAATWDRLHQEPIRWVRTAQLLTHLRSGFGQSDSDAAKAVIAGVGGIVLDDLDKVNPTEYGREVLFCAIDGRVQEGAPLLVTTNLTLGEIGDRLSEAVASRLAGYCRTVEIQGDDRRVARRR